MALRFGLVIMNDFPPGEAPVARIGDLREQTRVAERSGIESVWVLQHYLGSMPALQPLLLLDTGDYQHLAGADEAEQRARDSYLFTDPSTAIRKLKEIEAAGVTTVILRMQWFDLPQDRVLHSLELFAQRVLPAFQEG